MYRQSHWTIGLGALGALGLHLGGAQIVWSVILAATAVGVGLSLTRIAFELGLPHPAGLLRALRGTSGRPPAAICPHCGTAHA